MTTFIYIAIAVVVTAIVSKFIFSDKATLEEERKKIAKNNAQIISLTLENRRLKGLEEEENSNEKKASVTTSQYNRLNVKYQKLLSEANNNSDLKAKYEKLISEANTKIAELDQQLKMATEGKIDGSAKSQLAEVDKLKKKIKDLEDDLEDAEDDLNSAKKKLKTKEGECNELQDQLTDEKKVCTELKQNLDKALADLEDKQKELQLKVKSLLFVQEVLSAKVVSDDDVKALHAKVDNITNYVTGEMRDTVKKYFNHNENYYYGDALKKWAITQKKSWIQGKTTVAFVGEFSAGKTSIVNSILSQGNPNMPKLPVSTKATTAIPTYISGGVSNRFEFVTPDNIQKSISVETFSMVDKDVLDQVKGVSSLIKYFVMTYQNPNLNNLSILDTPGFNSNDKEDAVRTIEVINECDALFWVFDVNAGTVNRSSIQLIKQNLKKPLYVVINKVDSKTASEVDKVEQLIRQTLQNKGVAVKQFIRYSKNANVNDILAPIKSVPNDNSNEQYVQNLCGLMEDVVNQSSAKANNLNNEQNNAIKRCDALVDNYNQAINNLHNRCVAAARVPQWKEHTFSSDRYEMTPNQYNTLTEHLDFICVDCTDELCNLYNQQMEAQRNAQQAWADYNDAKVQYNELMNCKEQLNKLLR